MNSDRLVFVREITNHALGQHIEGSPEKDVVGRTADDVDLQIDGNFAETEGDITSKTEQLIDLAIGGLHIECDVRVVG